MILVSVSSYSQYPIIKKIKQDSVVIMTIEQGKEINALYLGYKKTIDSLQIKTKYYDSAINQISKKQDTINIYRYHIQNTKPTTGIQEFKETYEKEKGINRLWTLALFMALALIKTQ
jgi:hypothetical protein